jgi:hypothetical protein
VGAVVTSPFEVVEIACGVDFLDDSIAVFGLVG